MCVDLGGGACACVYRCSCSGCLDCDSFLGSFRSAMDYMHCTHTDKKKSMCNLSPRPGLENRKNLLFKTYDLYQFS